MAPLASMYRSLEDKAREHDIADLQDFYTSNIFASSGFELRAGSNHIVFTVEG
jgi:hypothetical protein